MSVPSRLAVVAAALLVAAGATFVAVAASAAPVPESGSAGLLTLDADPYPAQDLTIARGDQVLWPVTADLDAPTGGELTVRVTAEQPLAEDADALRFALSSCPEPWILPPATADASCAGGPGTIEIPEAPFATTDSDRSWSLGDIVPGVERYFLVTLSLPLSTPGSLADQSAEVSFGFTASGGRAAPAGALADTGARYVGPALLAAGLLLGGAVLAGGRRREAS